MSNTYNQIKWGNTPIPEAWYKILTEYTAKYAIKIGISQAEDTLTYFFYCKAADKAAQFAITKYAVAEDVKNLALPYHLDKAIEDLGLKATDMSKYQTWNTTTEFSPYGVKPKSAFSSYINKIKGSNKLNSLYELYGMVEPKIRYCKEHRPSAAQVWARIQEEEKQEEVKKTLKGMSPALQEATKAAFGKIADEFFKADPLVGFLKGNKGGFVGEYYTDYMKQTQAQSNKFEKYLGNPAGGAVSKEFYQKAQGKPSNCELGLHEWGPQESNDAHYDCIHCKVGMPDCPGCKKDTDIMSNAKEIKKLKQAAAKAKLAAVLTDANMLVEDPEDLF